MTCRSERWQGLSAAPRPARPASEPLADAGRTGRVKHPSAPAHFSDASSAKACYARSSRATRRTHRALEMSQCGRFSLTEGEQVPLPQSTNDPIISIRSHDWCYTPLLLLSSFPHVQVPPPTHTPPEPPGTGSTCPLKHSRSHRGGGRRRLWSRIRGLNENH